MEVFNIYFGELAFAATFDLQRDLFDVLLKSETSGGMGGYVIQKCCQPCEIPGHFYSPFSRGETGGGLQAVWLKASR